MGEENFSFRLANMGVVIEAGDIALQLSRQTKCAAYRFHASNLNELFERLAGKFSDQRTVVESDAVLRVLFENTIEEVRLDWTMEEARTFLLPGMKAVTPANARFSLVLGAGDNDIGHVALMMTIEAGSILSVTSNFAWERDDDRELHNDDTRASEAPLFEFTATAQETVSLVLLSFRLDEAKLPQFFRQLRRPLPELEFPDGDALCDPTPFDVRSLRGRSWEVALDIHLDAFDFPFLRRNNGDDQNQDQVLTLSKGGELDIDFDEHVITCPLHIAVHIGSLDLATDLELQFNWETFAFKIDHDQGIELTSVEQELASEVEFLGLMWRFRGRPVRTEDGTRYHYFTLATKDFNYQIQQAPGAVIEVDFTRASDEPITFSIRDFALTPKGINLTATVTDRPAKLNGIDTRFRFHGSRFEIKENEIRDFTLSGSGPLPPDLVGDAIADISLQFSQRNGNLTLVAGGAQLRGNKLLEARHTRFQFQIDAIGLKFVNDGKFHLYFTLTGSAQFVLADSDDTEGALAWLPTIKIDLIECPLTGDARVIAKHVKFLIELPKKLSFPFLGCFELELRGIGFIPQAEVFDDDAAMMLTGQLKFAQGAGDTANDQVDFHTLFIGVPEQGSFVPRIHFSGLPVHINFGAAFQLNGVVDFVDDLREKGFTGEGVVQIQGLPTLAAAFAYLRVREDETSPWVRAWFIFLEVRQVSFLIPVVEIYLREVGLGFGYRYTLASIKTADRLNDLTELLQALRKLSRTQGDLSKRDRWEVDIESRREDPRWTIALRAMISQTSASTSPLQWNPETEKDLACSFLFDAVIAFRSDLTFFMAVRAWINTNYHDFVTNNQDLRNRPLLSGFVLLSPRQKRLLAHLASNPDGKLGPHPPLPPYVQRAVANSQFSVTLLIEPGLFHLEMGWPNMLRWKGEFGPLKVEFRGGFIFRISRRELVIGNSFLARGSLRLEAGFNAGVIGARISATADVAYGARYIGVVSFRDLGQSTIYGAIGLELRVTFALEFWIRINLLFKKITLRFRFSIAVGFTAGLEVGLNGLPFPSPGLRGSGTVSIRVMGRGLHFNVRLGLNEGAVTAARSKTQRFLKIGLEATEVEPVPGVSARSDVAPERATRRSIPPFRTAASLGPRAAADEVAVETFSAPHYNLFVLRAKPSEEWTYFVFFPQGERRRDDDSSKTMPEPGFLPVPPDDGVDHRAEAFTDFHLTIPSPDTPFELEQFEPISDSWKTRSDLAFGWRADWDARIIEAENTRIDEQGRPTEEEAPDTDSLSLKRHLRYAFKNKPLNDGNGNVRPTGDPDPIADEEEKVEDERVHNPTDNAFEAAVRGAVEQFRGSPYFKKDRNNRYETILEAAFDNRTTIYDAMGKVPDDDENLKDVQVNEQAHQLRGMVIQDLIADLQDYVAASEAEQATLTASSIAFQMGLVFRIKGETLPEWVDQLIPDSRADRRPKIRQRLSPDSSTPSDAEREVRTFNIADANFTKFPPQFQRVQPYTDANTIAITWDLAWERSPHEGCTPCQAEPEHHLMHYEVRRRTIDGSERDVVYTVKSAETLCRVGGGEGEPSVLERLQPRFQVVDHFTQETLEDHASLPDTGRSYLYTITPIDFAGNPGRALTLVATRFPNEPPLVPVDGLLTVNYRLDPERLLPDRARFAGTPEVVIPEKVSVEWREPGVVTDGPTVPIDKYVLIFRKEATLPIGSYGLDSTTQGPRTKSLPTSNARLLPSDIQIEIKIDKQSEGKSRATVTVETLQDKKVFPEAETAEWRPEAWTVLMQTVSAKGVRSALAPVQLLLQLQPIGRESSEERRPAQLEWLPHPQVFPLLPPQDQRAVPGEAHFPMPKIKETDGVRHAPVFDGTLKNVCYQAHPAEMRCIRFRWNQGPSGQADYPLRLNAGYHLLELDIDAHTTETFGKEEELAKAIRLLQDIQMLPGEDLLLTPGDTLATSQWEAWYPSTMLRRTPPSERAQGSERSLGPWYSWRESLLEWPAWPGLTDEAAGSRETPLHPLLQAFIDVLSEVPEGADPEKVKIYNLDIQISPPIQPGDLAAFMNATAPKTDPYGWGILQRFGLCAALSLRDVDSGDALFGNELLNVIQDTLQAHLDDSLGEGGERWKDFYKFLHVELLFQPGQSVNLAEVKADSQGLLAIVQLSLRPVAGPYLNYSKIKLSGRGNTTVELVFNMEQDASCTLINQTDPASGEVLLEATAEPGATVTRTIRLPLNGQTTLLLRCTGSQPSIGIALKRTPRPLSNAVVETRLGAVNQLMVKAPLRTADETMREAIRDALEDEDHGVLQLDLEPPEPFPVTDERSTYFTVPTTLARDLSESGGASALRTQWLRFKRYAESINSNDPTLAPELKIDLPDSEATLTPVLAGVLAWSQRFFDAGGEVDGMANGPWLVTAYPRVGSPAYSTPDRSARLQYDFLLEDRWAHNYRYYIRPYGRYDLMWQSLRQSPVFFPNQDEPVPTLPPVTPNPEVGGLDVVLERTQPVAMPLVLSSSRLDAASTPARPAVPAPTWEVIVAQHPEQALIDRNQTLFRQLAFRHIAFTLLRRFAFPDWIDNLKHVIRNSGHADYEVPLRFVENKYPDIPASYPEAPDHVNFSDTPLADDVARSLALPERIGVFQQGALALQWEALPYFYEHRLLLVAQSTSVVSPVNDLIQRDFEYRAPRPVAIASGLLQSWQPVPPFGEADASEPIEIRIRQVQIPLQRFWDCLTPEAQVQWQVERPDAPDSLEPSRKLASLPDPDVVYQIVQAFSGNIEVQAEFFFDEPNVTYKLRQLGQNLLARVSRVDPPPAHAPQTDYHLYSTLIYISQEELTRQYDRSTIPVPTRHKIAFDRTRLSFVGVFTRRDRNAILLNSVDELVQLPSHPQDDLSQAEAFLSEWYSSRIVTQSPELPEALAAKCDYPQPIVAWIGRMTADQRTVLQAFAGASDPELKAALQLLATATTDENSRHLAVLSPAPTGEELPLILQAQLRFNDHGITWRGPVSAAQEEALLAYQPDSPLYQEAVGQVLDAIRNVVFSEPYDVPVRPRPGDELPGTLVIEIHHLVDWTLSWTGPLTAGEETALRALPGDEAFATGIARLIAQIRAVAEEPQPDEVFTEVIPFAWPRVDKAALEQRIQHALPSLDIPSTRDDNPIQWRGADNVTLPLTDLMARVETCFLSEDPFVTAFTNLLQQIATRDEAADFWTPRRPAQDSLPGALTGQLLIGRRLLRCQGPLTEPEFEQLVGLFPATTDQMSLRQLFEDLQDGQALERIYQAGFSEVAISQVPTGLPADLADTVDFPDPSDIIIVWQGTLSTDEEAALLALDGDEPFRSALERLAERATEAAASDVIHVTAPRGLDQVPEGLQGRVSFDIDTSSNRYTQLRWTGLLFDDDVQVLQSWAQLPDVREAIDALVQTLDEVSIVRRVPPPRPLSEELPELIRSRLQIGTDTLAWLGAPPDAEQRIALRDLSGDEAFRESITTLLDAIDADAGERCVVRVALPSQPRRPRQSDLPDLLSTQLTIEPTQLTWQGRLHSASQRQALDNLSGDEPFHADIQAILETLELAAVPIALTLPVRPASDALPVILRDKLLLGKARIRYHGLMTVEEGRALQDLLTRPTDHHAIQRLHDAALNRGLRGAELQIRALRGSATPSARLPFDPQTLSPFKGG